MGDLHFLDVQWERDWREPSDALRNFRETAQGKIYGPRVSQLDAAVLNKEVENILLGRLKAKLPVSGEIGFGNLF